MIGKKLAKKVVEKKDFGILRKSDAPGGDIQAKIREKAFYLFQERGAGHGRDLDDWLRAERLVKKS